MIPVLIGGAILGGMLLSEDKPKPKQEEGSTRQVSKDRVSKFLSAEEMRRLEGDSLCYDAKTAYNTAEDYFYGRNGKRRDYAMAVKFYFKADELGHHGAKMRLKNK